MKTLWQATAGLVVFLALGRVSAQDDVWAKHVAEEGRVLEELASHAGQRMPLSARSPVTAFVREYFLAPADAREIEVTDELLEKAVAIHKFKARDFYFPGANAFVMEDGRIMLGEVVSVEGENVKVKWVAKSGAEKSKILTRRKLAELNAPRYSPPGSPVEFVDVRIDPANDPLIQPMLKKARSLVDPIVPKFVEALQKGDLNRVTELQMQAIKDVYEGAMIDGQTITGYWSSPEYQEWLNRNGGVVPAGRAWVDRKGVCHTRAGVLFSAEQAELMFRMGLPLQLHQGLTSEGGVFHTWAAARLANGVWVYEAPSWAQGDQQRGFAGDINHIYGRFLLRGAEWGTSRIIKSVHGEKLTLPVPQPSGYSALFVENLVRAKESGGALSDADLRALLKKFPYEGGAARLRQSQQQRTSGQAELATSMGAFHRTVRAGVREAKGLSKFGAAYLLKEQMSGRGLQALPQMKSTDFWGSAIYFTVVSRGAEAGVDRLVLARLLPRGLHGIARMSAPLALGMAAVDLAHGDFDGKRTAVSTGVFLATSTALETVTGQLLPALRVRLPQAWLVDVAKLGLVLYTSEKIEEQWLGPRLGVTPRMRQVAVP